MPCSRNGADRAKALQDDSKDQVPGGAGGRRDQDRRRGEAAIGALVVEERQADLLQVVGALDPAGRLAGRLDGRKQQGDQDRDDRDDDQELDEREATPAGGIIVFSSGCLCKRREISLG